MKLTCFKKDLLDALQTVGRAVASKSNMQVLSGIYLKADSDMLDLEATDYELGISCKIPATILEQGEIVLKGRYFHEVVRRLPGEKVDIAFEGEEKIAHIKSGSANFSLLTMDPKDFPVLQAGDSVLDFDIKNNSLKELIRKTVFACAEDDLRPVFSGCYFEVAEDTLIMAATNTHRLAVKTEALATETGNIKFIVPAKALTEILHIIDSDVPTDVKLNCGRNKLSLFFENIFLTCRLIEGSFPDFQKVIPAEFATTLQINAADLASVVDRISLISRTNEYNIIRLEFDNNNIHLSSNNPDIGKAEEYIPVEINGPAVNIAFNAQYLADVLKVIGDNECTISLNQTLNPIAFREKGDNTFIYVVTPVRTTH